MRERDRWSGRSFPCPPLLFELFFHSSSSFCASFHSARDKALHSLPHSSTPPSISLTHPDPIPSLPAPLSSLRGPALAAIHQPDGPPLTGPPSILPPIIPSLPSDKHPHTHKYTQQPGHSPPYALYQAAAMLIGRKGWMDGGREGGMRRTDRAASL